MTQADRIRAAHKKHPELGTTALARLVGGGCTKQHAHLALKRSSKRGRPRTVVPRKAAL